MGASPDIDEKVSIPNVKMGTTIKISYVDKDNFPYATGKFNTQLIDYNAIKRDGKAFPNASLTKGWI